MKESILENLNELEKIIQVYDELAECWFNGIDPNDFAEDLDSLRNNGFRIINELRKTEGNKILLNSIK